MIRRASLFGSSSGLHPLWGAVVDTAIKALPSHTADSLKNRVRLTRAAPGALRIAVPGADLPLWVSSGHLALLQSIAVRLSEGDCDFVVTSYDDPIPLPELEPTRTLARFIVGPSNQHARHAIEATARKAGDRSSLLFLHGPKNSGKSHLLQAVAQAVALENAVTANEVICKSAEALSLELIAAIWQDELGQFRSRYNTCRALIIDDASALAERDATQTELAHTIDVLLAAGTPVIISAKLAPDTLPGLSADLREQLCRGQVAGLSSPEWETRVAILLDRARRWGVHLSSDVASYLTRVIGSDLGEIDRLLTRLLIQPAGDRASAPEISDVEAVRRVVERGVRRSLRTAPTAVVSLVAKHFNLRVRDLRSAARSRRVTVPRQVAMYLLREHCALSFPEIGRRFGRHHTTALHSCRRVSRELAQNGSIRTAVRLLEKDISRLADGG